MKIVGQSIQKSDLGAISVAEEIIGVTNAAVLLHMHTLSLQKKKLMYFELLCQCKSWGTVRYFDLTDAQFWGTSQSTFPIKILCTT
mmetsp:Transcript_6416/g.8031  ORF Transcript_6416/g.8031 Transcript_6416/m.8031 type:complete len:86 (-) Transcript_6416:158-415(-)